MQRGLHPETVERLAITGLSLSDFEKANERRHWLALLRVHKVIRSGVKWTSIEDLRKLSHSAWRTVKTALLFSYEQVLGKVRQAFTSSSSNSSKYINIKGGVSVERERGRSGGGRLSEAMAKCMAMTMKHGSAVPEVSIPRAARDREQAITWQKQIEKEKEERLRKNGDGKGIKFTPAMMKQYFASKKQRDDLITWAKWALSGQTNPRVPIKDQWANAKAYRLNSS